MAVPPFPVVENFPQTVGGREMETYVDWIAPTFVLSLTGLPVASVPAGLDAEGMPVGLQVVAPPRGEERALAVAGIVQRVRPMPRPPMAADG
jgi:amidase